MALSENEFKGMSIEQMWDAYSRMKVDRDSFDQLTLQLSCTVSKIDKLEKVVTRFESELALTRNANKVLSASLSTLRRKVNHLDQYGRRENIEISGIPKTTANLEEKVISLLSKIDVKVTKSDIVACHPLKRDGQVIVRFVNRKNADLALRNRKKLRSINTGDNQFYINTNLSPANLKIRWYCKHLKASKLIHSFGVDGSGIWVKKNEGDHKRRIEDKEDLELYTTAEVSLESFS